MSTKIPGATPELIDLANKPTELAVSIRVQEKGIDPDDLATSTEYLGITYPALYASRITLTALHNMGVRFDVEHFKQEVDKIRLKIEPAESDEDHTIYVLDIERLRNEV